MNNSSSRKKSLDLLRILAMFGIIVLAVSVNLVEMACSLGFPLVFNEILTDTLNSYYFLRGIIIPG